MADSNQQGNKPAAENIEGKHTSIVSERKRKASQENAKKSTGPRTARGKAFSRRNAITHGLLCKPILFDSNGKPINPELHILWESLQERYGNGDVYVQLLIEGTVTAYWRSAKALEADAKGGYLGACYNPDSGRANVIRYTTASQRALAKNLELLEKLAEKSQGGEANDDLPEDEFSTPTQVIPPNGGEGSGVVAEGHASQPAQAEPEAKGQTAADLPKAA